MTESLAVTAVLALAFALMYPAVIRTEDRFLASAFPEFAEYARRTPAFFPRLSLYRGESTWTVHVSSFQRNIADSVWFLGLSVVVESFDLFHDAGVLRAVGTLA
jgi:steroid 5-alpha reductase family enzyme